MLTHSPSRLRWAATAARPSRLPFIDSIRLTMAWCGFTSPLVPPILCLGSTNWCRQVAVGKGAEQGEKEGQKKKKRARRPPLARRRLSVLGVERVEKFITAEAPPTKVGWDGMDQKTEQHQTFSSLHYPISCIIIIDK